MGELQDAIARAAQKAAERLADDPDMNLVVFYNPRDFVEASTVGILRSRPPEFGHDPAGILCALGELMLLFEHRLISHMLAENRHATPEGEYAYPLVFHGTPLRALEVAHAILATISKFAILGQVRGGYDIEAVMQNTAVYLRGLAREQVASRTKSS